MHNTWLLGGAALIAGALLGLLLLRRTRPQLLSPSEAQRALKALLDATPMTSPWQVPDNRVPALAAQRISEYFRTRRGELETEPREPVAIGGVSDWWSLDEHTLRDWQANGETYVAAALDVMRSPEDALPAPPTALVDWQALASADPSALSRLRDLEAMRALMPSALAQQEPPNAIPTDVDVPEEIRARIASAMSETIVLVDQVDGYLSKASMDDPWRILWREGVRQLRRVAAAPATQSALKWLTQAGEELRTALNSPLLDAVVAEIGTVRERALHVLLESDRVREWFVDPSMLDSARTAVTNAREVVQQLEFQLETERASLVSAWEAALASSRVRAAQRQQQCDTALRLLTNAIESDLRACDMLDREAAEKLVTRARERLGRARFGPRHRQMLDWELRIATAVAGDVPEEVLSCIIAVPNGTSVVASWLDKRVQLRGALFSALGQAISDVRTAADHERACIVGDLEGAYISALDSACVALERAEQDLRESLAILKSHVEQLEQWAIREPRRTDL